MTNNTFANYALSDVYSGLAASLRLRGGFSTILINLRCMHLVMKNSLLDTVVYMFNCLDSESFLNVKKNLMKATC